MRDIEDQSTPLSRHFANCGSTSLGLQIIVWVRPGDDGAIFIMEGILQNMLATFTQHGNINVRDDQIRNIRFFDL